ncbi:hypothetical protein [Nonomuraea endophytica]|uniref:Uncharacterized protein n=1 Tax=Nonomuraea endophytica TaxID=714136 RepID=A0A7W8A300_9ACTN|nr:hypothetical protein [Nonomuraea endophytica]MBB5078034.1 hypothetical protein [Nonomuraea endophytica]
MHVGRPVLRALRATVFAVACVLASLTLHILAGGAQVRPVTLGLALALTWAGAYLLGRRQRGRELLLVISFAAQYGMHHLFTAGAEPVAAQVAAHGHGDGVGNGLGMLLVHAVVALISAWWLERGECALALLAHLAVASVGGLWARLFVLLTATPETGSAGLAPVEDEGTFAPRAPFVTIVSRRGPPLTLSVH